MASEVEIAWAAGLFEGEGCISIKRRAGRMLGPGVRLVLSTTDEDVIRRFRDVLNTGRIDGPYQKRLHYKPIWVWREERYAGVIRVLSRIEPYLGQRRQAKAAEARSIAWRAIFRTLKRASRETETGIAIRVSAWSQLEAALEDE